MLYKSSIIEKKDSDVFVTVGSDMSARHLESELFRFKFLDGRVIELTGELNFGLDGNLELFVKRFRHSRIDAKYILPFERDSNIREVKINRFTGRRKIQRLNDIILSTGATVIISAPCLNKPGADVGTFIFKGETFKPLVKDSKVLRIYNRILNFEEV